MPNDRLSGAGAQPCIPDLSVTTAIAAQSRTLLFRGLVIREAPPVRGHRESPSPSRLQDGDTAEFNSALRIADEDWVLVVVVYHTAIVRGPRHEVSMRVSGLEEGGFDAKSLYPIPATKPIRRRAALTPVPM